MYLNRNITPTFLAMNKNYIHRESFLYALVFYSLFLLSNLQAQPTTCIFKEPIIKIDFGTNAGEGTMSLSHLKRYNRVEGTCPDDGNYSFASYTENCFGGHWHNLPADHTPGDTEGRMMIVNAAERPGTFFMLNIAGLKPGATYEFANWIVNVCRSGYECTTIPPLIKVSVFSGGTLVKSFVTGEIHPLDDPQWRRYSAEFTLPAGARDITLQMDNEHPGGCGNDFAVDDITLRECVLPTPPAVETKQPTGQKRTEKVKQTTPVKKPASPQVSIPGKRTDEPAIKKTTTIETPSPVKPGRTTAPGVLSLPAPIATRENPVIKQISTEAGELLVQLYDNGQVDGDTVSIFHNNQLIKSRAALSDKPVTIKIMLDEQHPHHELVMVAENLGSIPPNTSLMIITAKRNRYEVFISSSEQKNAKIVIDLKQ